MKSIRTERRNGTNRCHAVTVQGRALLVYLPPSYSSGDRHYPVAYVQDGGGLIDDCANYLELLFREGKLPELILVGVATQNRNDEYTPWPAPALLAGRPDFGGAARSYLNELADTVKPYIDQHYRTQPASGHTGVIGASLGGMVSMLAGYWRPDVFGRIGMLSASLWYEGVMDFIREQAPPTEGMRIYMSVGGSEGVYKTNVQRNMVSFSRETHRLWLEKGFPPHRLRFDVEEGGTHDPLFMARRFPEALRFLFGGSGASGEGALRPARREDGLREESAGEPSASRQSSGYRGSGGQASGGLNGLGYRLPKTETFELQASRSGKNYRIFVSVPAKPAPADGYPILYALDGNACFASLAEAMRLQSRHPLGLEPGLIVGIGYDTGEPFETNRRFYDFTTPASPSGTRPDGSPWPETGGAEAFLSFIENELKPEIERRYPVDRERQALFGHSLGGFFVLHTLLEQPDAFRFYIAGSPSVWWDESVLLKRLPEWRKHAHEGKPDNRIHLMIGVGAEEKQNMVEGAKQAYGLLAPLESCGMRVAFELFDGEGHVSVIHPLISRMLRFVFQPADR